MSIRSGMGVAVSVFGWFAATVSAAPPVTLGEGQSPKQPQVAVSPEGTVHLVYGAKDDIYYSRSTDAGETFSAPKAEFRVPNLSLGMRRGPRISAAGKSLVVTAIGGEQGNGRDGDIQSWRSSDGGASWSGPVRVNDVAGAAREGLHAMAGDDDGSVYVTWLDLRAGKTEVWLSKSVDGGATWEANRRVYRSPGGSVCECCHPSIVVTKGVVQVLFRNSLAGSRDMYLTTSNDGGKNFSAAKKLGQGTWKLDACPMDGGMLAPGGKSGLVTVWRRNGEIYTSAGTGEREQLLGRGEQPWVTGSANGPVVVWTTGREGDLIVLGAGNREPKKLASKARDPVVSSAAEGPVIACWESKAGGQPVVVVTRIDVDKPKGTEGTRGR